MVSIVITGLQIRAARAALNWTAQTLADRANVGVQTIVRFERVDGVPPSRSSTLIDVQRALQNAGIEFVGDVDQGPGVRLFATGS